MTELGTPAAGHADDTDWYRGFLRSDEFSESHYLGSLDG